MPRPMISAIAHNSRRLPEATSARGLDERDLWDVRDLDNWIDSLKAGPSLDTSSIVDRLA